MQRHQLEHIIRAAAGITGAREFIIIGSQAVLGQFPQAPEELLVSIEVDIFTLRDPVDSDLIDGSIGEGSPFHQTFGYYAHGVAADTAVLPSGWQERLHSVHNENTGGGTGFCLDVHDLAVSKLVAGREKDIKFIEALLQHRLTDARALENRLTQTQLAPDRSAAAISRLNRLLRQLQNEFNFQAGGAETGYSQWVVVRSLAAEEAARKLNLPIGHEAEVWLRGNIRLRGKLRLLNDLLFVEEAKIRNLPLTVEGVNFTYAEIESCVRLD
jgi:hypothetical protein